MMETVKMILEVAVFAAGIYVVLRFLRETRGAGVVRGLSLILLVGIVTFTVLINIFELRRLAVVFTAITQFAIVGLIVVFQPEIRRAIVHLLDGRISHGYQRLDPARRREATAYFAPQTGVGRVLSRAQPAPRRVGERRRADEMRDSRSRSSTV